MYFLLELNCSVFVSFRIFITRLAGYVLFLVQSYYDRCLTCR